MNSCGVGHRGGRADVVVGRVPIAVGDVRRHRAVEQKHILLDDADQLSVALDVDLAQVASVEQDPPAGGIVKPRDQIAERRLAAAARTDQRDRFARLDVERHILQRERARIPDS